MRWVVRAAGGLIAILLLAGIALFVGGRAYDAPGSLTASKIVVIPKGAGTREIGTLLAANGIVENGYLFSIGTYATGRAGALKAGEYEFAAGISPAGAADLIDSGKVYRHKLTIPEGLTSAQIVALIDAAPALDGTIDAEPPEGTLLPDTYFYVMGSTRQELLTRLHRAMEKALNELWAARAPGLPLASPAEAVTLASIVEKETAKPDERPRVAGVFLERLKLGMKLQADPTVIYVLTRGGAVAMPHPLGHDDLAIELPYNTYVDKGLPPTPIDNPGLASLKAALQPDDRGELYFVADGTGHHAFAKTLDEHNKNVAKLRALQSGQTPPAKSARDSERRIVARRLRGYNRAMTIASMTGFARAEGHDGPLSWAWELKSVNSKSLDLRFRLPPGYDALELPLRALVTQRLKRGSVSVNLSVARAGGTGNIRVNREALAVVIRLANELAAEVEAAPPRIDGLLALRGVLESGDEAPDEATRERQMKQLNEGFGQALEGLASMRLSEGMRLEAVLTERLDEIASLVKDAEAAAGTQPAAIKARVKELIAALIDAVPAMPEERLAHEAALVIAKADVREELDRLHAHIDAARSMMKEGGAIGRRFDFLCQEFNREANTLCSKSADLELTRIGLALKAAIEQLREQVQNIE